MLAGVMGGNISTAQAYIADVTTHEDRAKGMGLLGAAFGIGFVMGPAISTLLMHFKGDSYALPGFFAAALSFISFALVLTKLPETVGMGVSAQTPKADEERVTRFGIFDIRFWKSLAAERKGGEKWLLPILMASSFVLAFGHSNLYSSFPLFCKSTLGFSAREVGMQFVWLGLITVIIQGGLIRRLEKKYGESKLFLIGGFFMVAGMALIPLAKSPGILTAFLALLAIGASLTGPTLNSLISKEADPHRVGAVMGSAQGLSALGRTIGPSWGGFLYGYSARLPFWATAACLCYTVWVGLQLRKNA
jgi:DHA1 family tetracycline resistance protein-like MFS transporter